ncbi:hypothetical protein E2562_024562 [Oryza meyeriana var. granulata]|uniref:Uncharacterized protein n=1 Tax=Oryza meyeriana var. granulata TaxID=110450 RepID=A0A6G1CU22_9ORYZ|nr:hypothetical protein E2562_024562 [Oryza meyeriana var. granulata]
MPGLTFSPLLLQGMHGPGGRMATRAVAAGDGQGQQLVFDHAAQFFTASDERFKRVSTSGLTRSWSLLISLLRMEPAAPKEAPLPPPQSQSSTEEEEGMLSVTAAMARDAAVLFQSRRYAEVLAQLLLKKEGDPKAHVSAVVAEKGLDFAKDVLIGEAVRSLTPLRLPGVEKAVRVPFLGAIRVAASNITLFHLDVGNDSVIHPGDSALVVVASGISANLSMAWSYYYDSWIFPIEISDRGTASILVTQCLIVPFVLIAA